MQNLDSYCVRVGSLNVGTVTGKGRSLADMMETRKVRLLCVKETRWKGYKRNSWGSCKFLRSGTHDQEWNGVGIVLYKELKEDLISLSRNSFPVMTIELGLEEMVVNIMCARAPQVGCIENEKETFW